MTNKKDQLFATPTVPQPFRFDESVAEVFPDMISRSVPGYREVIRNIGQLAEKFVSANSHCYDLGCSLGAVSLAMSTQIKQSGVKIFAIDNSEAMLERCKNHLLAYKHSTEIELVHNDIKSTPISNASMVVLNFTLQFIPQPHRQPLLENIYQGMKPGGILVISEKICFEDPTIDQLMIDLHHQFKRDNGYSDLEISQKRNALETVLIPETLATHIERLKRAGFTQVSCWHQHFNFVSLIAIK